MVSPPCYHHGIIGLHHLRLSRPALLLPLLRPAAAAATTDVSDPRPPSDRRRRHRSLSGPPPSLLQISALRSPIKSPPVRAPRRVIEEALPPPAPSSYDATVSTASPSLSSPPPPSFSFLSPSIVARPPQRSVDDVAAAKNCGTAAVPTHSTASRHRSPTATWVVLIGFCSRITQAPATSTSNEIAEIFAEIKQLPEDDRLLRQYTEDEFNSLQSELLHWKKAAGNSKIVKLQKLLESEVHQKEDLEEEITILKSQLLQLSFEADETRRSLDRGGSGKIFTGLDSLMSQARQSQLRDPGNLIQSIIVHPNLLA